MSWLFFLSMLLMFWFVWTMLVGWLSGWFRLTAEFPDQEEPPIFRLRWQSGKMRFGTSMQGILTLNVCETGLCVSMLRIFGPLCSAFHVPWSEIKITREDVMFWTMAKLEFGDPVIGKLTISGRAAKRLAAAAAERWPEPGRVLK